MLSTIEWNGKGKMNFNFHSYTIEKEFDKFVVFGHGEYPEDSVLAGQYARSAVGS